MEKISLETVQYSSLMDIDEVELLGDRDHEVLTDRREVLRKHGAMDPFGVYLLHKHFDLNENEVLMESTDAFARVTTVAVATRGSKPGRSIEDWVEVFRRSLYRRSHGVPSSMQLRSKSQTGAHQGRGVIGPPMMPNKSLDARFNSLFSTSLVDSRVRGVLPRVN